MAKKKNYKSYNIPVPGVAPWMRKKEICAINRFHKEQAARLRDDETLARAVALISAHLGW